jgi:hypothetical protein
MAKKATGKGGSKKKATAERRKGDRREGDRRTGRRRASDGPSEAFVALLQSPLVADLVAVAATTALATLAEHGFTSRGAQDGGKRTGRAVKEAGKAAAAAVGRRLSDEIDEIRKASKAAKGGAKG